MSFKCSSTWYSTAGVGAVAVAAASAAPEGRRSRVGLPPIGQRKSLGILAGLGEDWDKMSRHTQVRRYGVLPSIRSVLKKETN